jgi:hypothetical protein
MNLTLSIEEKLVAKARRRAEAMGKSLNQMIRDYLKTVAGDDDDDAKRDIAEFRRLSGKGNPRGWKFNRDELHERT